jgi:hypothetical protein
MTVFHSPDWQAIFGYIKTCVAYMTFPVEKGADYKATPTSDATGCSLRLEKLTSGSNQWEPVAVRKRALSTINGQICKPET